MDMSVAAAFLFQFYVVFFGPTLMILSIIMTLSSENIETKNSASKAFIVVFIMWVIVLLGITPFSLTSFFNKIFSVFNQ